MNLKEIEARVEAASEGPWDVWNGPEYCGGGADLCIGRGEEWLLNMDHTYVKDHKLDCDIEGCLICSGITKEQRATADFIAHARTDIPDLLAEVKRLGDEKDRLDEQLEQIRFCGNCKSWVPESERAEGVTAQCKKNFGTYGPFDTCVTGFELRSYIDLEATIARLKKENEWVSVKDGPPKTSGDYHVIVEYKHPRNKTIPMRHSMISGYFKIDDMWGTSKKVTHWKPITLPGQKGTCR